MLNIKRNFSHYNCKYKAIEEDAVLHFFFFYKLRNTTGIHLRLSQILAFNALSILAFTKIWLNMVFFGLTISPLEKPFLLEGYEIS